jgi:3-hydroxyisobutyrate dehydrogenase
MRSGATLLDCTSGDPATSRRIAERLASKGVRFVDAPVSGGVKGAEEGTLTVMCGGEAADIERVRPVLETFGRKIVHCGPTGAGDAAQGVVGPSSAREGHRGRAGEGSTDASPND